MSTTTAPTPPVDHPVFRPGRVSRAIAAFSGTTGLAVKISLLALMTALAAWAAWVLADNGKWIAFAVLVVATLLILYLYLAPRAWTLPAKFLIPGTVFLLAFQVAPIVYTISVAFTNYSTGHILSKPDAIDTIKVNSLEPPPNGRQYTMAPAHDESGNLVLILRDDDSGRYFVGTEEGAKPLPARDVTAEAGGPITAAKIG